MPETSTQTLAKTTRPFLASSVVPRPALFERLDAALQGAAIWIHGMPGAGKTCLISSFVETRGLDALWYQMDPGDSDPASFLHHLRHAARRRFGDAAGLPAPASSADALAEPALREFFRAFHRQVRSPFLLVLDNCHEVPVTSGVHLALSIAAQEMPARGTAVFLARNPPGPAMARLRASGALAVIAPHELPLTGDELRAMAEARGVTLDDPELVHLGESTRGWAAGLVLMLEHARSGGEVTRTPEGLAPQVVFDYLAWEVFGGFDPQVQQTLCAVAPLRRCTAALAGQVSGCAEAEHVLQNMARNSYFISRIDEPGDTWFELHPLLRSFLLKQAREGFDETERAGHVRSAALWLEEHGHVDEAVRVLVQAGDWSPLDQLVARIVTGSSDTSAREFDSWLRRVPDDAAADHPWLLYWLAHSRLEDDPRDARRLFTRAHERFGAGATADSAMSAWGALRAILRECDDLSLADAWIPLLESGLAGGAGPSSPVLREDMLRTLHAALLLRGADPQRLAACAAPEAASPDTARGTATRAWPVACLEACLRADFAAAADHMAALTEDDAARSVVRGFFHLLRGERDACRAALDQGHAALARRGDPNLGLLLAAVGEACRLGIAAAGEAADAAPPELPDAGPRRLHAALSGYLAGWERALAGEPLEAFHHLRDASTAAAQLGLAPLEIACQAALAEAAAACGDDAGAAGALARAREVFSEGFPVLDFLRRVAAAGVAARGDDPAAAEPALEAAFAVGRAHGLRFTLGLRPDAAAGLCARAIAADIEPEYARSLVRAHALVGRAPPGAPEQWPWPLRIHTLGGVRVSRHDEPQRLSGKGAGRLLDLLEVLVALGARDVPQERIAEILWPHVDGDYAQRSFNTTIYRLRKLLDVPDAILVREGRVSLNPACCWLDTWALESLLDEIEAAFWTEPPSSRDLVVTGYARELQRLLRGSFLAGDDHRPVHLARRAQIRRRVQRGVMRLAGHCESRGEPERAIDLLQHALDADPLAEGLCRELMLAYERLGRRAEGLEVYAVCRTSLHAAGGNAPESGTREIAERLAAAGPT